MCNFRIALHTTFYLPWPQRFSFTKERGGRGEREREEEGVRERERVAGNANLTIMLQQVSINMRLINKQPIS